MIEDVHLNQFGLQGLLRLYENPWRS